MSLRFRPALNALLLLASTALVACERGQQWELAPAPDRSWRAPRFVLLADTQYSIPATDYEVHYDFGGAPLQLTSADLSQYAGTFYRHSAANHVLPDALLSVLQAEKARGARFGVFAGDLIEFACRNEADRLFETLERAGLPFVIALGNHDVVFHGSYDLDALGEEGRGAWDQYSLQLWNSVCAAHGGPLDKGAMIERILDYYRKAWALPIPLEYESHDGGLRTQAGAVSNGAGWQLTFAAAQGGGNVARSHRTSYLWQRFTFDGASGEAPVTFTVLDTTDYAERKALCQSGAELVQIGMGGSLSAAQIRWLDRLGSPHGQHFVVSHYLPFASVKDGKSTESACSLSVGSDCAWAKRVVWETAGDATFIYAHVHRHYAHQRLTFLEDGSERALDLVRLPSLIDNKRWVVFEGREFREYELERHPAFQTEAPFSVQRDVCRQRFREYVELERNLACFGGTCRDLTATLRERSADAVAMCSNASRDWKARNAPLWQAFSADPNVCGGVPEAEHWRCILRALGRRALATLSADARPRFARAQLRAVATLPSMK